MSRPVTTAEKIQADIKELRAELNATTAALSDLSLRLNAVEELLLTLKTPEPTPTGVTVKAMCSQLGTSYDPTSSAVLKHYAESWCREHGEESWVNPDHKKQFRFFPAAAARYAVERLRQEKGGKASTNGNGKAF